MGTCKLCTKCGHEKLLTEFYTVKYKEKDNYMKWCKACTIVHNRAKLDPDKRKIYRKEYIKRVPQAVKDKYKNKYLIDTFGISLMEYKSILENQNHCCAICKIPQKEVKRKFAVDHCHSTGKVRGLLCDLCNRGLGLFKDNADSLITASEYLKKAKL